MVPVRRISPDSPAAAVADDVAYDAPKEAKPRVKRPRVRKVVEQPKPEGARRSTRFDEFDDFSREIELEMPYDPGAIAARATVPRRSRGKLRLPEAAWARWTLGAGAVVVLGGLTAGGMAVRKFFLTDPRFRIASSEDVVVTGNREVSADEVRAVFAEDLGRNIFYVPLDERREQLRAMPWVHLATVERLFPDHIGVQIEERIPTAFVQNKGTIELVDADGVVMDMPSATGTKYSFPVLSGLDEDVPQAERAARIAVYERFVAEINSGGTKVSDRISEMDMSDPEDVVATIPTGNTQYTVHFGDEHFLDRWKMFQTHLPEWQSQYPNLASMDLRNAPQVTLGMTKGSTLSDADALSAAAAAEEKGAGAGGASAKAAVKSQLTARVSEPTASAIAGTADAPPLAKAVAAPRRPVSGPTSVPVAGKARAAAITSGVPRAAATKTAARTSATPQAAAAAPAKRVVTIASPAPAAIAAPAPRMPSAAGAKPSPVQKMALHARPEAGQ